MSLLGPTGYDEWRANADVMPFPPTTAAQILSYRHEAVCDGYCAWAKGETQPGPNHSPGYRWGWANRQRDSQREDDGYDHLRHEVIIAMRQRVAPAADGGGYA